MFKYQYSRFGVWCTVVVHRYGVTDIDEKYYFVRTK